MLVRAARPRSRGARPGAVLAAVVAVAALLASTTVATAALVATQVPSLDTGAGHLAPLEQVAARPTSAPTTLLDRTGQVIGQFLPTERSAPIRPEEIPPTVAAVVTASEDPGFFDHHGFEPAAVVRAALANAAAGEAVEGGSTITQQLAKNLYTDGERTLARKVREVSIAVTLEDRYSKPELLAAYLTSTYFGEGAVGMRAAAATYFGLPLEQLDLSHVALLTGLIPAPTERDPRVHPAEAEAARQVVLDRVAAAHRADPAAIAAARAQPPALAPPPMASAKEPWFTEYVRQWLIDVAHLPAEQVLSGGLQVETTLDPTIQQAAVDAVAAHLTDPAGPTASAVVLDHRDGHVLALVGGRDWAASKVDLARGVEGGGTGRQPGSSFKPFVLARALQDGFRPEDPVPAPASMAVAGADHQVENFGGEAFGTLSLEDATVHSVNTSYTWLTEQVGAPSVRDLASALGVGHLPAAGVGPSIGLGAYEVSPLDMAAAYSGFAEDGRRVLPTPVSRVVAPDGTVLVDTTGQGLGDQVVDPAICRTVTSVLSQVVQRGTGVAAQIDRPVAGKTGTTDDYTNAWFVGYTAQLTGAVWVGYADSNTPMHGIEGVADVTGGSIPAAIWHDLMLAASSGLPVAAFPDPLPLPPSTRSAPPASTDGATGGDATAPAPGPRQSKPGKGGGKGKGGG